MKRAALIVGVNRYEDPDINKLEYAENDVIKLSGFLENRCLYNEVIPLLNPDAKTMLEVAGSMAGRLSAGDLFLLYFAGHGVRYAQQEVLLLPKARYDELEYYQDAVPLGLLKKKTRREGLNRAIVLDTCRTELLAVREGSAAER